ncbi:GvpL/GvpF family gas vesicle protein [Streptomyces sp. NPDC059009]|uniref:GvpL/GvpF family gas vesicle protein n=1 Tax=Streptomyces sp. NPDC059009 TaxID=3346694 RepID=UPI00369D7C05
MSDDLLYVYAVCWPLGERLLPEGLTGVGGAAPRCLTEGGLTAVVGPVPARDFAEQQLRAHLEELDWLTETARAHEKVVAALTAVTAPLPLRLATVFRDEKGVRALLTAEADRFAAVLARIDGRVEWGVKVYETEDRTDAAPSDGDQAAPARARAPSRAPAQAPAPNASPNTTSRPTTSRPTTGRDYLRHRRTQQTAREQADERAEEFARRVHAELVRHADAARLHPPQSATLSRAPGRNVLNAAYLVERSRIGPFIEVVERSKYGEPGLRLELTGPWAAYSFSGGEGLDGEVAP